MAAVQTPAQQFAKLPSSSKILILAVLLVLIGGAYYSLLHGPLTEQIQVAQSAKVKLEDDLSKAKDLQRRFLELREELEARKVLDQQNLRVLPADAEIAGVLAELNRIAELSGLTIRTVEPAKETAQEFYYRIPVKLQLRGRYHQLAKFFYNVSRLQRAINMENIKLSAQPRAKAKDADEEEVLLEVSVLATTFRRKDA
jgi:type IV pilus assembly protein PilO